ncbi:MBL fold metallo-hydrolase [Auraticoccus monumenti]|uniref:Glyoxylase, beta-lactamase superfamily II n=1 Tax=Auraticoccus monumenti TaxID=675864 RepID=A0A1G7EFH6_9ACTN|nr:MBL fold metallo-hydrolase [Auraticoccus monumenti]SDE62399.1 Glyoxylase, beta-lactamase superfamily II [Auraticoccus monumenti]
MAAETSGPWHEVADRVWTAVAQPESVSTAVVAGTRGLLVVDPGSSPEQGRGLRASAERLTGLPVLGAVATHAHHDHLFGLGAFDDLLTWGHEGLADALRSEASVAEAVRLGVDVGTLRPPNRPFALATGVDLGDRWVEMAHLGEGHTSSDVVVVVADADVVFVGDLLESATPPWFGEDSAPDVWPATLDSVIGLMASGRVTAVPGHGSPMGFEDALMQRGQIAAVAAEIERLLVAGVPVAEALEQGGWPFPAEHLAGGVRAGYRRLTERGVRPSRQLPITAVD